MINKNKYLSRLNVLQNQITSDASHLCEILGWLSTIRYGTRCLSPIDIELEEYVVDLKQDLNYKKCKLEETLIEINWTGPTLPRNQSLWIDWWEDIRHFIMAA